MRISRGEGPSKRRELPFKHTQLLSTENAGDCLWDKDHAKTIESGAHEPAVRDSRTGSIGTRIRRFRLFAGSLNVQKSISAVFAAFVIFFPATFFGMDSSLPSLTEEEQKWLSDNISNISLWYNDSFPPFEFAGGDGSFVGMGADVVSLVEEKLGVRFVKKVSDDWNRHLEALKTGECAIAPTIVRNPERDLYTLFTSSYAKVPIVIITTQSSGTGMSLEDFDGRKVAVVSGYATEGYLRERAAEKFEIITVADVPAGLLSVAFGKADAFVGNLAVASYHISRQGITNLHVAGVTDYSFAFRIGVGRKYPLLYSSIRKAVDAISPEELAAIQKRWITLEVSRGLSSKTVLGLKLSGIFLSLLILCLLFISIILKRKLSEKVTRLKQSQEKVALSEARFRSFFENAPLPFGELYLETGAIRLNRTFTETFGYTDEEVPDIDAWWPLAYPDPEYRKAVKDEWQEIIAEARPFEMPGKKEFRITDKNGNTRDVVISATIMTDRILVTFFDISDLNDARAELQKSLSRFEALFDLLPFSCVITDLNGRYLMVNRYFCKVAGRTREEIVGRKMAELGRTVDPEASERVVSEIMSKGRVDAVEMTVRHDGEQTHILFSSLIIDWKDEKAILTTTVDITGRKQAEEALRISEERLNMAFEAASDGLWDINLETEEVYYSPHYYRMLGYDPGGFPGNFDSWKKTVHPDDRMRAQTLFFDYVEGRVDHYETEFRMRTKQGGWRWVLSRGEIVARDETDKAVRVVGTHVDITEKKLAEESLRASEENLRVTLNSIGDAVIATDIKGDVTRMNPVAQQLTGWTEAEAGGRPLQEVFNIVDSEKRAAAENPVSRVLATGQVVGLANHTVLISRDGTEYQISDSGAPIRDKSGIIIGVVLVFRDVTGEYALQEKLRQSQKMESIGVLAGGIAHDFNNILAALMGFNALAKLQAGDNRKLAGYLDEVHSASIRARDLVRHILTFSRKAEMRKQVVEFLPIVKETLKFIRASLPANIEIRQDIKIQDCKVFGDPIQLHQVFMNLFTNAGYAMKENGGVLEVAMDRVTVSAREMMGLKEVDPGKYLHVTVSDTGCGIPKPIVNRIFEPFFTTKERGEGTGMGLSTVYGILKDMGGSVSVYSEMGVGTSFKLLIPEQTQESVTAQTAGNESLIYGEGRILLVDDEELIVTGVREILTALGYDVTGMASSAEALEMVENTPGCFDLVLTDMSMPEMNGLDLSKKIKALNPDIPIILATGFSEGLTKEICRSAGIVDMVMKPMVAGDLSKIVYNALKKTVKTGHDQSIDNR